MAKDKHDKSTKTLPLTKRGRPPKMKSGAMTAAERKAAERARRAASGESQIWVTPDEQILITFVRDNPSLFDYWKKIYDMQA